MTMVRFVARQAHAAGLIALSVAAAGCAAAPRCPTAYACSPGTTSVTDCARDRREPRVSTSTSASARALAMCSPENDGLTAAQILEHLQASRESAIVDSTTFVARVRTPQLPLTNFEDRTRASHLELTIDLASLEVGKRLELWAINHGLEKTSDRRVPGAPETASARVLEFGWYHAAFESPQTSRVRYAAHRISLVDAGTTTTVGIDTNVVIHDPTDPTSPPWTWSTDPLDRKTIPVLAVLRSCSRDATQCLR